jgi:hypothetical protein
VSEYSDPTLTKKNWSVLELFLAVFVEELLAQL